MCLTLFRDFFLVNLSEPGQEINSGPLFTCEGQGYFANMWYFRKGIFFPHLVFKTLFMADGIVHWFTSLNS